MVNNLYRTFGNFFLDNMSCYQIWDAQIKQFCAVGEW